VITIGIDVGGTKIAAGAVDADGTVLARRRIATEAEHPQAVVAGIAKVASELRAAAPAAVAVGVGAAGLIDVERGVVRMAPNIAWHDVHLRDLLTDRLGLPAIVDNDANVAAFGESLFGAGRGAGDQAMVTVGTGIGGGLVIGGAIYRGARGLGAELGHVILNEGGAPCACGNRGCFEAMASGNSIGRRARERAAEPEAKTVVELAGGIVEQITGEIVGEAAKKGDDFALSVFADTGKWLGVGLASLVNLLDPDVIVVGGGAAAGTGDLLLAPARVAMEERVIGHHRRVLPPVVPARLGYDAGLVGAAALARTLV
jgi:glucokinase